MTKRIESDDFARELGEILENVGNKSEERLPEVISKSVRRGSKNWKDEAKAKGWDPRLRRTYWKHGKKHTIGAYVRSIRSHMIDKNGTRPMGEIGSPKMPGMPHLLEFGHASPGGGSVRGYRHIAPAAEKTFQYAEQLAEEMIDGVFHDA